MSDTETDVRLRVLREHAETWYEIDELRWAVEEIERLRVDAARYQWLKAQFVLRSDGCEHRELVRVRGDLVTYRMAYTYSSFFDLRDDWRFGKNGLSQPHLDFDNLIDKLRAEEKPT